MKPSTLKVLKILRRAKSKGVVGTDFHKAFEYRKRISELRGMGYQIVSKFFRASNGSTMARYVLIKEAKSYSGVHW